MTHRPLIGINVHVIQRKTTSRSGGTPPADVFVLESEYIEAITSTGAECVLIPPFDGECPKVFSSLSGLVMIGGGDYDPRLQGCLTTPWTKNLIPERQELCDRELLRSARAMRLPVLAIGAGMQLMNVVFGGTLSFEIPEDFRNSHPHVDRDGETIRHRINVVADKGVVRDTFTSADTQRGKYRTMFDTCVVTSRHHQSVMFVAQDFSVTSKSFDGITESIESDDPDWLAVGVQFHPESSDADKIERSIFSAWVDRIESGYVEPVATKKRRRTAAVA